ncbi:hypothetical protein TNCV_1447301 [Trichonephila clavipes]|nr:hypothetical protein TNCV_1447301 [Trichonephila clavipes]
MPSKSHFAIQRALVRIGGEPKSVKRLRSARNFRIQQKPDTSTVKYAFTYRILCTDYSVRCSDIHKLPAVDSLLALDAHVLDMSPQIAV